MPWVALLLLVLVSCTKVDNNPKPKGPVKELPLAEYRDTTILDMYEGSRLSWILKTHYLVKWPRTDLVRARPVDLNVFDSLGKTMVRVTSDSGSVDEAVSFLVASGHVHGHSEKGVDITTDSLRWNKAINQISTEARVRVVSEDGDVLTGRGFLSDAKLDHWQILSDVKGVFQKVQQRFEEADKDTAKSSSGNAGKGVPAHADSVARSGAGGTPVAPSATSTHADTAKPAAKKDSVGKAKP